MKKISLVTFVFLLASCSSGSDNSSNEASENAEAIAPHGIHLGSKKSEIDILYPTELRQQNTITEQMISGKQEYGKLYFGENNSIKDMGIGINGYEITDSLLGESHVYNNRYPDTFELVTDTKSNQSYVAKMSIQRLYLKKIKCQDHLVLLKKELINKFGEPKRIANDTEDEFRGHYQEAVEKRNEDGQIIKEGTDLYTRISCNHNNVFLQIFGTNYDLLNKYSFKK